MLGWLKAKRQRWFRVGKKCEVCGSRESLVGHHLIPRSVSALYVERFRFIYGTRWMKEWDSAFQSIGVCRIRCRKCEFYLHRHYQWGNLPREQHEANIKIDFVDTLIDFQLREIEKDK